MTTAALGSVVGTWLVSESRCRSVVYIFHNSILQYILVEQDGPVARCFLLGSASSLPQVKDGTRLVVLLTPTRVAHQIDVYNFPERSGVRSNPFDAQKRAPERS